MLLRLLELVAPNVIINRAMKQIKYPKRFPLRSSELKLLEEGYAETMEFRGHQIRTYHWPGKGPKLLLVHGWEGQTGNFATFIPHLLEAGYDIHASDAPGHGLTESSDTSVFEFAHWIKAFIELKQPSHVVSHSFGAVPVTYALSKLDHQVERYLMFTTPNSFEDRIRQVSGKMGLRESTILRLIDRLAALSEEEMDDASVANWGTQSNIAEALILHDIDDQAIPIDQARGVVSTWKLPVLEELQGTGHFKILKDAKILTRALKFLKDGL